MQILQPAEALFELKHRLRTRACPPLCDQGPMAARASPHESSLRGIGEPHWAETVQLGFRVARVSRSIRPARWRDTLNTTHRGYRRAALAGWRQCSRTIGGCCFSGARSRSRSGSRPFSGPTSPSRCSVCSWRPGCRGRGHRLVAGIHVGAALAAHARCVSELAGSSRCDLLSGDHRLGAGADDGDLVHRQRRDAGLLRAPLPAGGTRAHGCWWSRNRDGRVRGCFWHAIRRAPWAPLP